MLKEEVIIIRSFWLSLAVFILILNPAGGAICREASAELVSDLSYAKLANGASVIVDNYGDTELVTVQIRVMSGLSNEGKYAGSGISHLLEHLLFKGTGKMDSLQLQQAIKDIGGIVNASTGFDSAEYHITVPGENFIRAFRLLSEMVMEPEFSRQDFHNEKKVVLNEIRFRKDDPLSMRIRKLFSNAYDNIYRYPVIGEEDKLLALTRQDVIDYHRRVYTPDRTVIGIAGAVGAEEAVGAAKMIFGGYEPGGTPLPGDVKPAENGGKVIASYPRNVTLAYMAIGFHTTDILSPDLCPTDVLSLLLGQGNASKLYDRLVREKELLYDISTVNYTPRYPGLFIITGIGEPSKIREAREEIFNVISGMREEGIAGEGELQRAKNLVLADYFHSSERPSDRISLLTDLFLLTGRLDFMEEYVSGVQDVSAEDVRRVLDKYLQRDSSATVYLMPSYLLPESEIKREGVAGKEMSAGGAGGPGTVPASAGAGALAEQRKEKTTDIEQGVRRAGPESSSIVLGNGLKIIAIKRGRVPLVSAVYVSEGGLRAENEDTNGLSNLTASLMVKGTDTRSEEEIIPVVERMGGSLAPFSGNNSNGLVMDILKENFPEGLDVFADVLINASFPPEEIEKGKKKIKAMIKEEEKSLFSNGMIHLKRLLYPDHPYGMRRSGSIENVEGFSREEIESFHCERYSPSGGILVITGAIEPSEAIKQAEKRFASWEGPGTEIPDIPVKPLEREKQFALSMDKEQSLLLIGYHGLKLKDPEKYPLEVIASLLSGSNGILFQRLREEQGLVYTSGGTSSPETDRGYFIFYAATDVEGLQKAGEIIDASIKDISEGDFRREDTEASIEWLVTRHAHSLQTNHSLALTVSLDELYGLGALEYKNYPDRIRAVRKDGISSVAEQIFQGSPRAIVVIRSSKER